MGEGEPRREFRRTRILKGSEIPGKGTKCRRETAGTREASGRGVVTFTTQKTFHICRVMERGLLWTSRT